MFVGPRSVGGKRDAKARQLEPLLTRRPGPTSYPSSLGDNSMSILGRLLGRDDDEPTEADVLADLPPGYAWEVDEDGQVTNIYLADDGEDPDEYDESHSDFW